MTLGERIKTIRKSIKPKISQEKFGEIVGVGRDAITSYEINRVVPNDAIIKLICLKFGINEKWLRTGEGEMFDTESKKELFDKIRAEYGLTTDLQCKAMELFLNATPEQRELTLIAVQAFVGMFGELANAPPKNSENDLSSEEWELIEKYRALSEQAQERIRTQINLEYEQTKNFAEESSNKVS